MCCAAASTCVARALLRLGQLRAGAERRRGNFRPPRRPSAERSTLSALRAKLASKSLSEPSGARSRHERNGDRTSCRHAATCRKSICRQWKPGALLPSCCQPWPHGSHTSAPRAAGGKQMVTRSPTPVTLHGCVLSHSTPRPARSARRRSRPVSKAASRLTAASNEAVGVFGRTRSMSGACRCSRLGFMRRTP